MVFGALAPIVANASTLLGVQISQLGAGAEVAVSFSDALPTGWTIDGDGTQQLMITLPQTHGPHNNSFAGVNTIVGVTVTERSSDMVVMIQLAAAQRIGYRTESNRIVIDVPAPAAHAPEHPIAAPPGAAAVSDSQTEVIPLHYADAGEVAGVLADPGDQIPAGNAAYRMGSVFSLPIANGGVTSQPQINGSEQTGTSPDAGHRVNEHIAIDSRLNAVVLTGTPEQLAKMSALVAQLDRPAPSVMLDCEVVELSEAGAKDLGLDFTQSQGGPIATGTASIGAPPGSTSGAPPVFTANFMGQLYATISHGNGKVLAFPRILAESGTPAQILTGDAIPIISTTVFPGPPVTTQTTINYITVGVNLQIVARTSGDGTVVSRIFTEVSSVAQEIATPQGNVPEISLRQAGTTATVQNGESFVIGGLLEEEELRSLSRLPILSAIPLIGGLFKVEHDS
jgi:general secretion pathway protein D